MPCQLLFSRHDILHPEPVFVVGSCDFLIIREYGMFELSEFSDGTWVEQVGD